MKDSDSKVKRW